MKTAATIMLALAVPALAGASYCPPDTPRVFDDVPANHPMCTQIESLYRDGLTSGCRVEEGGQRYFCPDEPLTRAAGAAFSEHRDPFAMVRRDGRVEVGDHVVYAERVGLGHYWIQFSRNLLFCSLEAWPHDLAGYPVKVKAGILFGTVNVVEVFTTIQDLPVDMWFNVRLHCR